MTNDLLDRARRFCAQAETLHELGHAMGRLSRLADPASMPKLLHQAQVIIEMAGKLSRDIESFLASSDSDSGIEPFRATIRSNPTQDTK